MVFIGDGYDIPPRHLKKANHKNLLRLARYVGLRYGLEEMSHKQLAKLIRWRITRGRMRR